MGISLFGGGGRGVLFCFQRIRERAFLGGGGWSAFWTEKGGGRSERSDSLPVRVGKQFDDILHKVITQNIIIHKDTLDDMDRPQCISGFSSLLHQTLHPPPRVFEASVLTGRVGD